VTCPEELQRSLDNALSLSFKHEAIVEEFIEGREISVEFISYHGVHYPLMITDKVTTGAPHFVELEHHQPAELSEDQFEKIYSITQRALDALEITEGASHTEYKITESGEVYIVELGARMGGDFIGSNLVRLSTGYDFVKGVIDVALDSFEIPVFSKKCHSGVFFLCKETERLLPFFQNETASLTIIKKEMTDYLLKSVSCSADRSGYLIYQADKKISL
jgi:biotin carboxylase